MIVELEADGRGNAVVWLVWQLRGDRPELAAVCSTETIARLKARQVDREGGIARVEGAVPLDHLFCEGGLP